MASFNPSKNGSFVGLTAKSVTAALAKFGPNELQEKRPVYWWHILWRQVRGNFIVYLLAATVVVTFFVEKNITGYAILGVIVLVVAAGFIQEYKAERAIAALRHLITPVARVVRDGREQEIAARDIVPGDLLVLRAGEKVPADGLVRQQNGLAVNEAVLTGEASEVSKTATKGHRESRDQMVFMGSLVVRGKALVEVVHTGMNTKFGQIADLIDESDKRLLLQLKVNQVARYAVIVGLTLAVAIGLLLAWRAPVLDRTTIIEILIVVIAIAVSSFPEGFPVVLVSTLAAGAYRMAQKNAIVNRMSIIETLGEATLICVDKTGTITTGDMTVQRVFVDGQTISVSGVGFDIKGMLTRHGRPYQPLPNSTFRRLCESVTYCNDAVWQPGDDGQPHHPAGSPTEAALLVLAAKTGVWPADLKKARVEEIPFTSERKMMSVVVKDGASLTAYVKGAPEALLARCDRFQSGQKVAPLSAAKKRALLQQTHDFAGEGWRVLAAAYRPVRSADPKNLEERLVFLGLVALDDPPREGVKEALRACGTAGIKVKMITGDNEVTARQVATNIGLRTNLISGAALDRLSDEELSQVVLQTDIFARVQPEHKLRIVKALKEHGEIVTMTGDGVNDAPAIKEAHIGVAMGIKGTDVSREAADLVLRDDNFITIVEAIKEGRTIYANIQKFITYQLSCNMGEILIVGLAVLFGWPLPLLAMQILFMNMVTDNLPAITLGFNPASRDALRVKAVRHDRLLSWMHIRFMLLAGLTITAIGLISFAALQALWPNDLPLVRSATLLIIICLQLANAFNFRSFRRVVFGKKGTIKILANQLLIYSTVISLLATLLIIYTPARHIFETVPIPWSLWPLAAILSLFIIFVVDSYKRLSPRSRLRM